MKFLDEIEARLNRATPGPWFLDDFVDQESGLGKQFVRVPFSPGCESHDMIACIRTHNAEFIAACPTDISKLVKALRIAMDALNKLGNPPFKDKLPGEIIRAALAEIEKMGEK